MYLIDLFTSRVFGIALLALQLLSAVICMGVAAHLLPSGVLASFIGPFVIAISVISIVVSAFSLVFYSRPFLSVIVQTINVALWAAATALVLLITSTLGDCSFSTVPGPLSFMLGTCEQANTVAAFSFLATIFSVLISVHFTAQTGDVE